MMWLRVEPLLAAPIAGALRAASVALILGALLAAPAHAAYPGQNGSHRLRFLTRGATDS